MTGEAWVDDDGTDGFTAGDAQALIDGNDFGFYMHVQNTGTAKAGFRFKQNRDYSRLEALPTTSAEQASRAGQQQKRQSRLGYGYRAVSHAEESDKREAVVIT